MSTSFLITGLRLPAALDWVRRLGRAGHRVAAAESFQWPLGRTSRYLSRYDLLPYASDDSLAYAMAVKQAAEEFGADWIIPNSEEIFFLSHHRQLFDGQARLFAEPLEVLEMLHHKGKFAHFTQNPADGGMTLQAPESHEFSCRAELEAFADSQVAGSLESWVLKAAFSRFAAQVHVRPNRETLRSIHPTSENPWIAQRYVAGLPLCTYSLAVDGVITAHSGYFPKHSYEGGAGFYFEPVERADLLEFAKEVVARLKFTGQISFDFISGEEGTYVIECNPRATSGLFLLDQRDPVPFFSKEALSAPWSMDSGPKMLSAGMLLFPGRCARWKDYRQARDVLFVADDPLGWLAWPRQFRELLQRSRQLDNHYNLIAAASEDCQWNGGLMK